MKALIIVLLLGAVLRVNAQEEIPVAVRKEADSMATIRLRSVAFVSDPMANTLSRTQLFREIDQSGYDLFNANLSFSDKDQVQKLGFSPLKLVPKVNSRVLSSLRLSMANRAGALTTGISMGYDESVLAGNALKQLKADVAKLFILRARGATESLAEYTRYVEGVKDYNDELAALIEKYDLKRLQHVFKASVGYNLQFFPILRSRSENTSFDSLNYHGYKGRTISVSGSYSYKNGSMNLEASYNFMNKRKAADSTQTLNRYDGFSLGLSKRLFSFIPLKELRTKDFYLKTRFVPSVYLGVAYEQSDFLGKNYLFAEEGVKKVSVISPFLDIAVSPAMQFRITIPVKNTRQFDSKTKGETVNALFQVGYKLVNLN